MVCNLLKATPCETHSPCASMVLLRVNKGRLICGCRPSVPSRFRLWFGDITLCVPYLHAGVSLRLHLPGSQSPFRDNLASLILLVARE